MKKNRKKPLAEINVVPYIDVMLVLLVIFMITAPLLTQGIHVNLPKAQARALKPTKADPIVVSVDAQGHYFLNTTHHPKQSISEASLAQTVAELLKQAKQHHQKRDVYVKGDRDVNYGKVVHAMVLLQQAGAKDVGLITQPNQAVS